MIEFRWIGRQLQYRERSFQVDAAGAFCGVTEFGKWQTIQQRREMPPIVDAAKNIVSQFEQHGVGPEFPELQTAIEKMQNILTESITSDDDIF